MNANQSEAKKRLQQELQARGQTVTPLTDKGESEDRKYLFTEVEGVTIIIGHAAQRRLIDELLSFFGGNSQPVMAHLIESGSLMLNDIREAEKTLRKLARKASRYDSSYAGFPTHLRRAPGEPPVAIDRVYIRRGGF